MKARSSGLALLAALIWIPALGWAQSLQIVEVSESDAAAAAKLIELIEQPAKRVRMPQAEEPLMVLQSACAGGLERVVILDGARHRVHLVRCSDATVLTRVVTSSESSSPSYVMAFVAVELIALSAQLEGRVPEPPLDRLENEAPAGSTRAQLRLGAELIWLGAPFDGSLRPTLGAGVWLALSPQSHLWWVAGLDCALLGRAETATSGGRVLPSRSDVALRAGVAYELGRLAVLGLAQARAALTSAEFLGAGGATSHPWGWGMAVGLEADLRLTGWAVLYASTALDFAALRSDYRVEGLRVAQDPARLANVALGLAFFQEFR